MVRTVVHTVYNRFSSCLGSASLLRRIRYLGKLVRYGPSCRLPGKIVGKNSGRIGKFTGTGDVTRRFALIYDFQPCFLYLALLFSVTHVLTRTINHLDICGKRFQRTFL